MKPVGLFVLLFYQIGRSFSSSFTVSKPIQNRHKRYSFGIVKRYSAIFFPQTYDEPILPFVFGMLGERLCQSKALGNFEKTAKGKHKQNSRASLAGRPLTDCALPPVFGCAERQKRRTKQYSSVGILCRYVGKRLGNTMLPVPVHPCRKGVQCKAKISEE